MELQQLKKTKGQTLSSHIENRKLLKQKMADEKSRLRYLRELVREKKEDMV